MELNVPQKIEIFKKLDPLHVKSHKKISPQKVEKRHCYGLIRYSAALQGLSFLSRQDYLHLKINHIKFQLNPIRNG